MNPHFTELQDERSRAHLVFDRLWAKADNPGYVRRIAYEWLATQMALPLSECHFSKFTASQCRKALRLARAIDTKGLTCWASHRRNLRRSLGNTKGTRNGP